MRTTRFSLSAIVVIGLLAGSAVGVAAQDKEAESPEGVSHVIGFPRLEFPDEMSGWAWVDGHWEVRGAVATGATLDTSDPRLDGPLTRVLNRDVYYMDDSERVVVETEAWRIDGESGAWSGHGSGTTYYPGDGQFPDTTDFRTVLLTGEGDYEGLSAYLLVDLAVIPFRLSGSIFPGELPPFPETPSATGTAEAD